MTRTPIQLLDNLKRRLRFIQEEAEENTREHKHYTDAMMHLDLAADHYRKARFMHVHDPDLLPEACFAEDWGYDDA